MKLVRPIERWSSRTYDPDRGDTLHKDIFIAARTLIEEGHPHTTIFDILRKAADAVEDRVVPDRELLSAIDYASAFTGSNLPRWPKHEPLLLAEVIQQHHATACEIIENAKSQKIEEPMDMLCSIYPSDSLLCLAFQAQVFATAPMSEVNEWFKVRNAEYIVPNPMSKLSGMTKDGKDSVHCDDNTGPKRFQVIEFDSGDPRNHVACHIHLGRQLPLMMLVYSGGKSVHGWFRVTPESDVRAFFYEACLLGADEVMWSKTQFTRLPEGINNKTGRRQRVLYFDPRHTLQL